MVDGVEGLLEQVEAMLRDGGIEGFDARAWLAGWMGRPVPALGGVRPEALMGTAAGRARVAQVLAQMGSGAYA